VCESPRKLWTKTITVGTPARATSAASCSGPLGSRCEVPAISRIDSVGELDQLGVEKDRLDVPDPLPLDLDVLLGREPLGRLAREAEELRELVRVEVPLVEQLLRGLHDRVTIPGFGHDAARRAHRTVADLRRDRPDLQRELRRARERVAPLVHRRRPRVRRLPAPR
jgi:hypothetical protein